MVCLCVCECVCLQNNRKLVHMKNACRQIEIVNTMNAPTDWHTRLQFRNFVVKNTETFYPLLGTKKFLFSRAKCFCTHVNKLFERTSDRCYFFYFVFVFFFSFCFAPLYFMCLVSFFCLAMWNLLYYSVYYFRSVLSDFLFISIYNLKIGSHPLFV